MIQKILITALALFGLCSAFNPAEVEAVRLDIRPTINVRQSFQNPEQSRRIVHRKYYPPIRRHYCSRDEPLYVYPAECREYYEEVYVPEHRTQKGMDFGIVFRFW